MEERNKNCVKIRRWLIFNKGKVIPLWIKKHLENCTACREFERDEISLLEFAEIEKGEAIYPSCEFNLRVKKAIFEVSDKLSKERKPLIHLVLSPKVSALIAAFVVLLTVFYLPLYGGENYFALRFNKEFNNLLAKWNSPLLVSEKVYSFGEDENISGLKFMNAFFGKEPYRSFYYAYRDLPISTLLTIKFFSELSKGDPSKIYEAIKEGSYAKASRILGLSYRDTISKFNEFLNNASYLNTEVIKIDGLITSIDYIGGKIYLDSVYEPVFLDFETLNEVYIGEYVSIDALKEDDSLSGFSISQGSFESTVVRGILFNVKGEHITLSNLTKPINVTNGTIVKNREKKVDLSSLLKKDVVVRAILKNDEFYAISVSVLQKGEERVLSGELSRIYKFGFTLKNVELSFYYSSKTTFSKIKAPSYLRSGDLITIKGVDYGNAFSVDEIVFLRRGITSFDKKPVYVALASSPKDLSEAPINEFITHIDYVVGISKDGKLFLKSGRVAKPPSSINIPLGAKIKIALNRKDNTTLSINLVDFGKIKKLSSPLHSIKVTSDNVFILRTDSIPLFLYSEDSKDLSSSCIIQARYIDYGDFGIVEKERIFNYREAIEIRGYITKIIEEERTYLLDNGYILNIDELSLIEGNSLLVGRTVSVTGVLYNGVVTGYIVKVGEDFGFISGTITEINLPSNYLKLDSGIVIKLDLNTVYSLSGKPLSIGDQIICKVLLINGEYLAREIYFTNEYNERIG